jgi:hypothetical protein
MFIVRFVAVLVLSSQHIMLYQYSTLKCVPTLPHCSQLVIENHSPIQRSMTNEFKEALLNNHCRGNEVRVPQLKDCTVFLNLK